MSLAEELLNDLNDTESEPETEEENTNDEAEIEETEGFADTETEALNETIEQNKLKERNNKLDEEAKKGSIFQLAKLTRSKMMVETLKAIEDLKTKPSSETPKLVGIMEEDPEYKLIVDANTLVAEIDNEIVTVIKYIRDKYEAKFRGLDNLITKPMDYVRTILAIGNETDITKIDLKSFLPSATVMILTMVSTSLPPSTLSEKGLKQVFEACHMAIELDESQRKLIGFVESRMNYIAPNLSAVIGTTTAAKLLGAAGGLNALSRIPACNIQILGSNKAISAGLSKASTKNHFGFIYYSEIVSSAPHEERAKVARIVANKVALAVRIDRSQSSRDGSSGRVIKEEILKKIEILVQPPPSKTVKALPVPDDAPKKRRGGRRVRKMKESMAITELRRAQNRINFGEAEDELHGIDSTVGLGTINTNRGKIRAAVADSKTKASVSKRHKAILAKTGGMSGTMTSGFATSLAFTPVQGLELENPEAKARRIKEANDKYFGSGQTFINIKKKE